MAELPPSLSLMQNALRLRELVHGETNNSEYRFLQFCFANAPLSSAQLFQDLFALYVTQKKQPGFFVEFGAADGRFASNTYLLETRFQWNGILAEPARKYESALRSSRKAAVDTRCVWSETGRSLVFNEAESGELSTIDAYSERDEHGEARRNGRKYAVDTVSLNDLLRTHDAPRKIDYLSVDTEGSELEILKAFDFTAHDISVVTVEHNYDQTLRGGIFQLMDAAGYDRAFETISSWDDWYIKRGLSASA